MGSRAVAMVVGAWIGACGGGESGAPDGGAGGGDGAPPGTTTLAWFSDWRTATGATTPALFDGGKWNDELCNADVLEVVPATGLDFPTANVLKVDYPQPSLCRMLRAFEQWPAVGVGEYLFVRLYYRNDMPDGSMVGFPHPIHLGEGAPYAAWFNFSGPSGGTTRMTFQHTGATGFPDMHWSFPFTTGHTYRLELRLHRATATTAKVTLRVHDATGALVGENEAWHNGETGPNSRTLAQSDPTITVTDGSFRLLEVGNNDPAGLVAGSDRHLYFGGVAVAIGAAPDAWPGPYPTVTEAAASP